MPNELLWLDVLILAELPVTEPPWSGGLAITDMARSIEGLIEEGPADLLSRADLATVEASLRRIEAEIGALFTRWDVDFAGNLALLYGLHRSQREPVAGICTVKFAEAGDGDWYRD